MFNNITPIIVSYKSTDIIKKSISFLNNFKEVLILENSGDEKIKKLKKNLKKCKIFIPKKNLGYGAGNNYLLKKVKTKYALIINPDVFIKKEVVRKLLKSKVLENLEFAILAPYFQNKKFVIGKIKNIKNFYLANEVKGFLMLLNIKKILKIGLFDENFFLYLEEIDLCKRLISKNEKIILSKSLKVNHIGASSSNINRDTFEKIRNWHWMWSKFYFSKKYYGEIISLIIFFPQIIKIILKKILYIFLFDNKKSVILTFRLRGLLASIFRKKSYLRPEQLYEK